MTNHIIVGANFGDEGKGLVTSRYANKLNNNIVIRFNGGGQAAHTVELKDGRRHVFHHIGSGTLHGSPTFLSEHFIVNPEIFIQEYFTVPEDNIKIFCHRNALLTTPYDWLLNRNAELIRRKNKHGSCGAGINETVTRISKGYKTFFDDIFNVKILKNKLNIIKNNYLPKRAKELNVNLDHIINYNIDDYIENCQLMTRLVIPVSNYNILKLYDNKIFEGAQGLLLDEDHYYFPHVTRSKTGHINASKILKIIGETEANIHYVTRTYLTRHGNGPLHMEGSIEPKNDFTNKFNKDQGKLRFAMLDSNLLADSIIDDLLSNKIIKLHPSLSITWGQHNDPFKSKNDYLEGKDLNKVLNNIFPQMKQNWFTDKFLESIELR